MEEADLQQTIVAAVVAVLEKQAALTVWDLVATVHLHQLLARL